MRGTRHMSFFLAAATSFGELENIEETGLFRSSLFS
jgi:hypothetical protein